MAEPAGLRTGIYDLGYRPYEGPRLGRRYAATSLWWYTLRAVFGFGRSTMSKVFPIGLAVIALIPALVHLAVAAVAPEELEFAEAHEYFGFVSVVLGLFCAVAAPEVVGRDQRHHTLALYFSRSLSRYDYVTAKLAALGAGVFLVLALPEMLLLSGNAVATDDVTGYLQDEADLVPPIVASSLLIGAMMGSISLAISSQTPRRAWATGAVILYFVTTTTVGAILFEALGGDDAGYALLVSPFAVLEGSVLWIFGEEPALGTELAEADLGGAVFFLTALAYAAAALAVLYRRFLRLTV